MTKLKTNTLLFPPQERFCQEYIKDFNAARAARDAGYTGDTASRGCVLLQNLHVERRIRELAGQKAHNEKITPERVLSDLGDIKRACMEDRKDLKIALRALELEAKLLGMINDRHEFTGAGGGPVEAKFWVEFVKAEK